MRAATVALMAVLLCKTCLAQPAMPKPVNPPFDAERKVREYLKDNCRDPSKLEFLAFSKPFNAEGCEMKSDPGKSEWGVVGGRTTSIYVRYKTLNTENQIETITRVFFLGADAPRVMFALPPDQFRTGSKANPFSKEFLYGQ